MKGLFLHENQMYLQTPRSGPRHCDWVVHPRFAGLRYVCSRSRVRRKSADNNADLATTRKSAGDGADIATTGISVPELRPKCGRACNRKHDCWSNRHCRCGLRRMAIRARLYGGRPERKAKRNHCHSRGACRRRSACNGRQYGYGIEARTGT